MRIHHTNTHRAARLLSLCMATASILLSACKDEENAFQPAIGTEAFSFKPIAGGSIMHYKLPADKDIAGINVRYKNFCGKDIIRTSSALLDSITLIGFNEAKENVNAEVRLVKRNGEESEPIAVNFSTKASAPWAFFDNVKVKSGWNGFTVDTDNPDNATGMAHIFYLGTNPLNGEPDTVLIKSFNLEPGKESLVFNVKQKREKNTIVIRTEDFNGYMVREEVYPDVISYNTKKLEKENFDFYCDKSVEDEEGMLGQKYLFDGDLRGTNYYIDSNEDHFRTFLAGPDAIGEPMYIDMHKNHLTAQLSFYAWLSIYRGLGGYDSKYSVMWNWTYDNKLPCDIDVYAAKDDGKDASNWDSKEWVKVGSYKQDPDIEASAKWCYNCFTNYRTLYETKEAAEKADPISLDIVLPAEGQGEGYRYLKIVVNDTYDSSVVHWNTSRFANTENYVTFHELDLYTKED